MPPLSYTSVATLLATTCLFSASAASFVFNEATDGDLSDNPATPTVFGPAPSTVGFSIGSNLIQGTTVSGDFDILSFTVPAGYNLSSIELVSYTSTDDRAFLGAVTGPVWNNGLGAGANFDASTLLGYAHIGVGAQAITVNVGQDALDVMATAPGAIGFTGDLAAGTYTFLIQETAGATFGYSLDFQVTAVPENAEYPAIAGLALAGFGLWRRWSKRTS